jgi:hypothetical protein
MPANLIWQSQAREDLLLIYKFVGLDLVRSAIDHGDNFDFRNRTITEGMRKCAVIASSLLRAYLLAGLRKKPRSNN